MFGTDDTFKRRNTGTTEIWVVGSGDTWGHMEFTTGSRTYTSGLLRQTPLRLTNCQSHAS